MAEAEAEPVSLALAARLRAFPHVLPFMTVGDVLRLGQTRKALLTLTTVQCYEVHLWSLAWVRSSVVFVKLSLRFPSCRAFTVQSDCSVESVDILTLRDLHSTFWQRLHDVKLCGFHLLTPANSGSNPASNSPLLLPLQSIRRLELNAPRTSVARIIRSCSPSSLRYLSIDAPLGLAPNAGHPGGDLHAALAPLRGCATLRLCRLHLADALVLPAGLCASLRCLSVTKCGRLATLVAAGPLLAVEDIDVSFSAVSTASLFALLFSSSSSSSSSSVSSSSGSGSGSGFSSLRRLRARHCTGLSGSLVLPCPCPRLAAVDLGCCRRLAKLVLAGVPALCRLDLDGCAALVSLTVHQALTVPLPVPSSPPLLYSSSPSSSSPRPPSPNACSVPVPLAPGVGSLRRLSLSLLSALRSLDLRCPGLERLDLTGCAGLLRAEADAAAAAAAGAGAGSGSKSAGWLGAVLAGCPLLSSSPSLTARATARRHQLMQLHAGSADVAGALRFVLALGGRGSGSGCGTSAGTGRARASGRSDYDAASGSDTEEDLTQQRQDPAPEPEPEPEPERDSPPSGRAKKGKGKGGSHRGLRRAPSSPDVSSPSK